MSAGA
jgi:hypothetical protein